MTIDELLTRIDMKAAPAPEDEVDKLEQRIGHPLPDDYRKFLIACNGGFVGGSLWYKGVDPEGDEIEAGLHHIAGFREEPYLSINGAIDNLGGRIPSDLLYIHDDPFGNAILIGLTGDQKGRIYFWDHEEEAWDDDLDFGDDDSDGLLLLANSFTEYVAGLTENEG